MSTAAIIGLAVVVCACFAVVFIIGAIRPPWCECGDPCCGGGCFGAGPKPDCYSTTRRIGPQERAENDCSYCPLLATCNARHAHP